MTLLRITVEYHRVVPAQHQAQAQVLAPAQVHDLHQAYPDQRAHQLLVQAQHLHQVAHQLRAQVDSVAAADDQVVAAASAAVHVPVDSVVVAELRATADAIILIDRNAKAKMV